eukprot:361479-Hanusia_phi.AAC.4
MRYERRGGEGRGEARRGEARRGDRRGEDIGDTTGQGRGWCIVDAMLSRFFAVNVKELFRNILRACNIFAHYLVLFCNSLEYFYTVFPTEHVLSQGLDSLDCHRLNSTMAKDSKDIQDSGKTHDEPAKVEAPATPADPVDVAMQGAFVLKA